MNLQEEWSTLVEPSHAAWTWRVLSALYTEPHRAYHNLDHVQDCLRTQLRWAGSHDPIVSLALFFHDAVYVPGDKRNEELSAGLLRAVGGVLRLSHGDVERAVVAVLATSFAQREADSVFPGHAAQRVHLADPPAQQDVWRGASSPDDGNGAAGDGEPPSGSPRHRNKGGAP